MTGGCSTQRCFLIKQDLTGVFHHSTFFAKTLVDCCVLSGWSWGKAVVIYSLLKKNHFYVKLATNLFQPLGKCALLRDNRKILEFCFCLPQPSSILIARKTFLPAEIIARSRNSTCLSLVIRKVKLAPILEPDHFLTDE